MINSELKKDLQQRFVTFFTEQKLLLIGINIDAVSRDLASIVEGWLTDIT